MVNLTISSLQYQSQVITITLYSNNEELLFQFYCQVQKITLAAFIHEVYLLQNVHVTAG